MIIIASYLISESLKTIFGDNVFSLKPYAKLDAPVSSHPDMLICVIDKYVFCFEEYYLNNIDIFKKIEGLGYKIIKTKHICDEKYPNDIGLNVLIVGKKIFCNKKFTATEVIEYAENNGYKIINVKQGYSACSTFLVDENNAITSDLGMKIALEKERVNVVTVSNSNIILEGYNCGFIGGSGFLFNKKAYFFGDINCINDYGQITKLLENLHIEIINVLKGKLKDYGGIKIFL